MNVANNIPHHPQSGDRPLVFTIARTMKELSISRSTVNRLVAAGKLTKQSLGPGSARITTASIYSLLGMD